MSDDPNERTNAYRHFDASAYAAPTFTAEWEDQGTLQAVGYSEAAGVVTLRGTAKATGTIDASEPMFTLPAGFRPPVAIKVPTLVNGVAGLLSITAAGVVSVNVAATIGHEVPLHVMFSTEADPA